PEWAAVCGEAEVYSSQPGRAGVVRAPRGLGVEQLSPVCDWLRGRSRDRVRVDGKKTRTSDGAASGSDRSLPLKPEEQEEGLSGPPVGRWAFRRKGDTDMLNTQEIRLGTKNRWLFGRICSFLILIPPAISFSGGLLPIDGFVAAVLGWLLVMFLMRGWSYGQANSQYIVYVTWIQQKRVCWDEVSGIHTDSMGIKIKLKNRNLLTGMLHFNRLG